MTAFRHPSKTMLSLRTTTHRSGVLRQTIKRTHYKPIVDNKCVHPRRAFRCRSAPEKVTGIVFEPVSEAQVELTTIDKTDNVFHSIARSNFAAECEAALNEQINVEYNISYVYSALFAYFDRDNVALPGIARFFKDQSQEEKEHAEKCMEYQNTRGGRVQLQSISAPTSEYYHKEKVRILYTPWLECGNQGDALYAMELALSLEKLNFQKLRDLWDVANDSNDAQMCDFVETELLEEQVKAIKEVSEYVSQLRRVGLGHGVFHFDRTLNNHN